MKTRVRPPLPYPGLRPFEEADSMLFFGREAEVSEMLTRLETRQFVAVVGSSGSGKSSLVKAGLVPAIRDGFLLGIEGWLCLTIKPGHDPYGRLARELVRTCPGRSRSKKESARIERLLRSTDYGLLDALAELYPKKQRDVILVVDQFEELFAFRSRSSRAKGEEMASKDDAEAFVSMFLHACNEIPTPPSAESRLRVVLTMRSDFIGHCEAFLGLPEAVSRSQFLVPRMGLKQMDEAIRRPGEVQSGAFQSFKVHDDLVQRIINDTGNEPDHLPLMQHALMRTWKFAVKRVGTTGEPIILGFDDYKEAGEVARSLDLHAADAWEEIEKDPVRGFIAKRLFLLLCEKSKEGQLARRRPKVSEVMGVARCSLKKVEDVVRRFQVDDRNFILPSLEKEGLHRDTHLDVSHESLFRNWQTLKEWMAEEENAVEIYRVLLSGLRSYTDSENQDDVRLSRFDRERVSEWEKKERPNQKWAARYGGDFRRAMDFLKLCRVDAEKRERENEERLKAAKREEEASIARSENLFKIGTAKWKSGRRAVRSVALAKMARSLHENPANSTAKDTVCRWLSEENWSVPLSPVLRHEAPNPVLVAAAPFEDGLLLVASNGGLLSWPKIDGSDSDMPGESDPFTKLRDGMEPNAVAGEKSRSGSEAWPKISFASLSDDGRFLVTVSSGLLPVGHAQFWKRKEESREFDPLGPPVRLKVGGSAFRTFSWAPGGKWLVMCSYAMGTNNVRADAFKFDGLKYTADNSLGDRAVSAAGFSADGKTLATTTVSGEGSTDCEIRFWEVKPESLEARPGSHPLASIQLKIARPFTISFDANGRWLVVAPWAIVPVLFDLTQEKPEPKDLALASGDRIARVAFCPAGPNEKLLSVTTNDCIELADPNSLEEAPDDETCAEEDGATGRKKYLLRPATEPLVFQGNCLPVFSKDGQRIAALTGSSFLAFDHVQLWEVRSRRTPVSNGKKLVIPKGKAPGWLIQLAEVLGETSRRAGEEEDCADIQQIYSNASFVRQRKSGVLDVIWQRFARKGNGAAAK